MGGLSGKLKPGWCDIIAKKLKTANSLCSFGFKKRQGATDILKKKSAVVFKAKAYCTFNECQVTCGITGNKKEDGGIVLFGRFSGAIKHHRSERRARRIKGADRDHLKAELSNCSPSTVCSRSMNSLPVDMLVSGNRELEMV